MDVILVDGKGLHILYCCHGAVLGICVFFVGVGCQDRVTRYRLLDLCLCETGEPGIEG